MNSRRKHAVSQEWVQQRVQQAKIQGDPNVRLFHFRYHQLTPQLSDKRIAAIDAALRWTGPKAAPQAPPQLSAPQLARADRAAVVPGSPKAPAQPTFTESAVFAPTTHSAQPPSVRPPVSAARAVAPAEAAAASKLNLGKRLPRGFHDPQAEKQLKNALMRQNLRKAAPYAGAAAGAAALTGLYALHKRHQSALKEQALNPETKVASTQFQAFRDELQKIAREKDSNFMDVLKRPIEGTPTWFMGHAQKATQHGAAAPLRGLSADFKKFQQARAAMGH